MAVIAVDLTTAPVLVAIACLAVLALAAVWLIPQHQARRWARQGIDGKDLADLENGARGTLVQIVGGIALILTFAATWMQIADARKATNRTLRLNAAQQETDRFTRAIEQLGSKRFEIRLGSIYSLESAAIDTPRERRPIVQLMVAYLRRQHPTPRPPYKNPVELSVACRNTPVKAPEDTQAAFGVIVEFGNAAGIDRLDLSSTDLVGVRARGHAALSRADFGFSSLVNAQLAHTRLDNAIFSGTDLRYACLAGADLRGAYFYRARLKGADFSEADLSDAAFVFSDLGAARISPCTRLPSGRLVSKKCPL